MGSHTKHSKFIDFTLHNSVCVPEVCSRSPEAAPPLRARLRLCLVGVQRALRPFTLRLAIVQLMLTLRQLYIPHTPRNSCVRPQTRHGLPYANLGSRRNPPQQTPPLSLWDAVGGLFSATGLCRGLPQLSGVPLSLFFLHSFLFLFSHSSLFSFLTL